MKTIYLIDGSSFAYRAFYAIGQLSTHTGQPTNAVYGFIRMFNKLIDKYKPEYIAVAFDIGKPTFRHKQYEQYKAHRKPMPGEMISQIAWIKKVISAYNVPLVELEGYEADDIIATMAVKAENSGFNVYIVTSDKDMMQLVNTKIKVLNSAKEDFIYDTEKIKEKFGVEPDKITHLLALTGDSSDNIPGVPGIGEKTAARLILQFGDINGVLGNLDKLLPKLKIAIEGQREQIKDNLDLVTIRQDVPLDINPEDCNLKEPDINMLKDIFRELEFKAMLRELLEKDTLKSTPLEKNSLTGSTEKIGFNTLDEWEGIFGELKDVSAISITKDSLAYEKGSEIKSVNINAMPELKNKIWEDIIKLLQNPDIKKYGYDIKSLLREGFIIKGSFFDTFIAESILNTQALEKGPDLAAQIYKSVPNLEKQLIDEGLFDLYQSIELPLISVLAHMERCGIKLDVGVLKELSIELEGELLRLTEKIYKLADESFNINSPKQLEYILFEKLKLPKGKRTKTGYSTDVSVLEKLTKYHELPRYLLDYRQFNKLKGTYIDPLPQLVDPVTQRLHTTFNQVGAITGRISSSNPNLQNIPVKTDLGKRIRRAFISGSPDLVLLGADYSQIELRILAHLSGDKSLINAFQEGRDIHTQTAQELFGAVDITPELRRQAKMVNFGIIYGMGAKAMAGSLGISIQDAQKFIDTYMERYPGVGEYIQNALDETKEHGYVVTMFGRKRRVPELFSSKPEIAALGRRIAINTPIQGSSADIIKMAMINIYKGIREKNINANMLLQIHDELIFEVKHDLVNEVCDYVKNEMENVVKLNVSLKVSVNVGRSWADL